MASRNAPVPLRRRQVPARASGRSACSWWRSTSGPLLHESTNRERRVGDLRQEGAGAQQPAAKEQQQQKSPHENWQTSLFTVSWADMTEADDGDLGPVPAWDAEGRLIEEPGFVCPMRRRQEGAASGSGRPADDRAAERRGQLSFFAVSWADMAEADDGDLGPVPAWNSEGLLIEEPGFFVQVTRRQQKGAAASGSGRSAGARAAEREGQSSILAGSSMEMAETYARDDSGPVPLCDSEGNLPAGAECVVPPEQQHEGEASSSGRLAHDWPAEKKGRRSLFAVSWADMAEGEDDDIGPVPAWDAEGRLIEEPGFVCPKKRRQEGGARGSRRAAGARAAEKKGRRSIFAVSWADMAEAGDDDIGPVPTWDSEGRLVET